MKRLIPITLILIIFTLEAGCSSRGTINKSSGTIIDDAHKTLLIQRDIGLQMTEISGFRIDMSPRKVARVALRQELHESKYNDMTLEDITKTNDFKPYGGYFYFEKKVNGLLNYMAVNPLPSNFV